MTERKLCIGCRHFGGEQFQICNKHVHDVADEYTGVTFASGHRIAAMDRRSTEEGACGPDAKFWEAK